MLIFYWVFGEYHKLINKYEYQFLQAFVYSLYVGDHWFSDPKLTQQAKTCKLCVVRCVSYVVY